MDDCKTMRRALNLAERGCGRVNPNPMVGAVIVKDGQIIGEGYHEQYGGLHAERNALRHCKGDPRGATVYVTLEPCCHWGKTPPCTDALLKSGIARVVIGSPDPNPLVAGKGTALLRQNGLTVTEGVLREECDRLNEVFLHYIQQKTPYVVMKYAMTMDGKIATVSGKSQWITGETARLRVQEDRNRYSAIMVGVGTVLTDDPTLTCRLPGGRNPVRVICDTSLRTPETAAVIKTAGQVRTILATCCRESAGHAPYLAAGCEVAVLPERDGHVDLQALMTRLGERGIDSILLEGGGALNWSALRAGIVRKVQAYLAPKLFGGMTAKGPVGGDGVDVPDEGFRLTAPEVTRLGEDLLLESKVIWCSQES